MTKAAALHQFFSGFGIDAYALTSVPDDATFPYLTYQLAVSAWEEGDVNITVELWFRTESEAVPNAKAQQLSEAVGPGGRILPCGGGYIWLRRGSPWCQSLRDEADIDSDNPSKIVPRAKLNVTDAQDIWWVGDRADGGFCERQHQCGDAG